MKIVEKSVWGPPGALGTLRGRPGTRSGRARDANLRPFGRQVGHLGRQVGAPGRQDRAFGRSGRRREPLRDAPESRSPARTKFASIRGLCDVAKTTVFAGRPPISVILLRAGVSLSKTRKNRRFGLPKRPPEPPNRAGRALKRPCRATKRAPKRLRSLRKIKKASQQRLRSRNGRPGASRSARIHEARSCVISF